MCTYGHFYVASLCFLWIVLCQPSTNKNNTYLLNKAPACLDIPQATSNQPCKTMCVQPGA